jgi:DNA-binding CsgD family transcriptional regulator
MDESLLPMKKALQIWAAVAKTGAEIGMEIDLALHKQLLEIISSGPFYYYVLDFHKGAITEVSKNVSKVLGYDYDLFSYPFLFEKMHPEDTPYYIAFVEKSCEFLARLDREEIFKYKIQFDFRIKNSIGEYLWMLTQIVVMETSEAGGINKTFAVHTDISRIKTQGKPVFSIWGHGGAPSFMDVELSQNMTPNATPLSAREKEVMLLLLEGKKTSEIANLLNLSEHTVRNHRKNIMSKTHSASIAELIVNGVRGGWR